MAFRSVLSLCVYIDANTSFCAVVVD